MQIGAETVETVRMRGKDESDTALVHPDQVKAFQARGYKVVKPETPKP